MEGPWGIAFNKYDDPAQPRTMLVSSYRTNAILQYDTCDGAFVKKFATVPSPRGLKFATLLSKHKPPRSQKMLLAASHYSDTVRKYNALTGSPLGTYAVVRKPMDIVLASDAAGGAAGGGGIAPGIFVTSGDAVMQFNNPTGAFVSKFTDKAVSTAQGLTFGGVGTDPSRGLFVTGPS